MRPDREIIAEAERFFSLRPRDRRLKMRALAILRGARVMSEAGNRDGAIAAYTAAMYVARAYYESGDVNVPVIP